MLKNIVAVIVAVVVVVSVGVFGAPLLANNNGAAVKENLTAAGQDVKDAATHVADAAKAGAAAVTAPPAAPKPVGAFVVIPTGIVKDKPANDDIFNY